MKAKEGAGLRPFEKRLVVVVGLVLFVVLNFLFVFPHFNDWGKVQFRKDKARRMLQQYENEVRQIPRFQGLIRQLGAENANVPVEEQNLHFANTRERVAAQAGVNISNASKVTTRTNQFFLELTQTINLVCRENQLVDFLYNLGSGNSLIRVRELGLKPDPTGQNLSASVTLAASYQKKSPVKAASPAPATRPAVSSRPPASQTTSTPQAAPASGRPAPAAKVTAPAATPTPSISKKP